MNKILQKYNLSQSVSDSTRITQDSKTLIDLCVTNCPDKINFTNSLNEHVIADHNSILVSINLKKEKDNTKIAITSRNHANYSPEILRNFLLTLPFQNILFSDNIDTAVATFNELFQYAVNCLAPYVNKSFNPRKKQKWMTAEILRLRKRREALCEIAHRANHTSNDSKKLWKTMERILPRKKQDTILHSFPQCFGVI